MFTSTVRRVAPVAVQSVGRRTVPTVAIAGRNLIAARTITSSSAPTAAPKRSWMGLAAATVAVVSTVAYSTASASEVSAAAESGLNPKEFVKFKLAKRFKYNHNTDLFVFELKDPNAQLNLPVASYIVTRFIGEDGKPVIRPYTPVNQHVPGQLQLLIKNYDKGVMSKHIHNMKVGDELEIKGPLPKFDYKPNSKKHIGMIAGGTGLTPMMQVLEEIITNPEDKTEVTLVFANTSQKDILLKQSLDGIARKHPNFHPVYVIDKPEEGFKGETGYLNAQILKKYLPKPSKDTLILTCGPPGFMNVVSGGKTPDYKQGEVTGALKELGFDETNVFKL